MVSSGLISVRGCAHINPAISCRPLHTFISEQALITPTSPVREVFDAREGY